MHRSESSSFSVESSEKPARVTIVPRAAIQTHEDDVARVVVLAKPGLGKLMVGHAYSFFFFSLTKEIGLDAPRGRAL